MVNLFCCRPKKIKKPIPKTLQREKNTIIIPSSILQLIYSHLDNMGSNGLYSCLLVNRHWHSNVLPILWKRPFTSKPLSSVNSVRLIETLLLCFNSQAKESLRTSLKQQKLKLIIPNRSSSYDYASLLTELDYKELEKSIYFYLLDSLNNNNNNNRFITRRSGTIQPFLKHVHIIAKNLFMLFMKRSTKFESLIIDKFGDFSDLPIIEIQQRSSNILSRIKKLHLNYYESSDIFDFIRLLPSLCNNLIEFTVNIHDFDNEALIHRSIADIIISQKALQKFSIEGARNGGNTILTALGDSQSESLTSVRFKLTNFKSAGMKSLTKCDKLREIILENCQGLTPEITRILYNAKFKNLKKLVIWNKHKAPPVTSMMIRSAMKSELKDLTLDTIIIGTVNTILEHCPNITTLKIFDYQPKHDVQMFRLLRDLPFLERLTIYRETNVELGVINFSGRYLPNSIKCLRLECGINPDQLDILLKGLGERSKLNTLIIDYFKLEVAHLKAIVDWVEEKQTLKFLGIGGKSGFSRSELAELKILQNEYDVFIIPSHRLDYY